MSKNIKSEAKTKGYQHSPRRRTTAPQQKQKAETRQTTVRRESKPQEPRLEDVIAAKLAEIYFPEVSAVVVESIPLAEIEDLVKAGENALMEHELAWKSRAEFLAAKQLLAGFDGYIKANYPEISALENRVKALADKATAARRIVGDGDGMRYMVPALHKESEAVKALEVAKTRIADSIGFGYNELNQIIDQYKAQFEGYSEHFQEQDALWNQTKSNS